MRKDNSWPDTVLRMLERGISCKICKRPKPFPSSSQCYPNLSETSESTHKRRRSGWCKRLVTWCTNSTRWSSRILSPSKAAAKKSSPKNKCKMLSTPSNSTWATKKLTLSFCTCSVGRTTLTSLRLTFWSICNKRESGGSRDKSLNKLRTNRQVMNSSIPRSPVDFWRVLCFLSVYLILMSLSWA